MTIDRACTGLANSAATCRMMWNALGYKLQMAQARDVIAPSKPCVFLTVFRGGHAGSMVLTNSALNRLWPISM